MGFFSFKKQEHPKKYVRFGGTILLIYVSLIGLFFANITSPASSVTSMFNPDPSQSNIDSVLSSLLAAGNDVTAHSQLIIEAQTIHDALNTLVTGAQNFVDTATASATVTSLNTAISEDASNEILTSLINEGKTRIDELNTAIDAYNTAQNEAANTPEGYGTALYNEARAYLDSYGGGSVRLEIIPAQSRCGTDPNVAACALIETGPILINDSVTRGLKSVVAHEFIHVLTSYAEYDWLQANVAAVDGVPPEEMVADCGVRYFVDPNDSEYYMGYMDSCTQEQIDIAYKIINNQLV